MDSLITAAARALAVGDPVGALKLVSLREDAPALALRGIAMAQLGDLPRAKTLVRAAARAFGAREPVARARCIVAEAEIALAARDLGWPTKALEAARETLVRHGDKANAAHAGYLEVRRHLLIGRLDEAERALGAVDAAALPPALRTAHELAVAGIAMRRVRARRAQEALKRAGQAANAAGIPALSAEVESAMEAIDLPAARVIANGMERSLRLQEVETLLASKALVVDAIRYSVRGAGTLVSLATRPVLFTLARALAEGWPGDVSREELIARAFRTKHGDDSHRARLRVELGRLRALLRKMAGIDATPRGFALVSRASRNVVVLTPAVEEDHAEVLALLADGESWSSSALAVALGASQRTLQRSLESLAESGSVQAVGQGRARRWMRPAVTGSTTILLLPAPLPGG